LSQVHFIAPTPVVSHGPEYAEKRQITAQGEFRGHARWVTSPYAGIDAQSEDPREGSDGLGALLAAIDDEVGRHTTAARDGVTADFAARVAHARKHLSPHLLAATLATIKEQRKAALAQIGRNAANELAGRKKAAVEAFGRKEPRRSDKGRNAPGAPPTRPPNF
jgi:hypothetical protein